MKFDNQLMAPVALALLTALVVSFLMTPVVKSFAYKVGAIDVPKDERRMHKKPIPRLGGWRFSPGSWPASCSLWTSAPTTRCKASCWAP